MIILKKPEITIVLVYQVYLYIIKKKKNTLGRLFWLLLWIFTLQSW